MIHKVIWYSSIWITCYWFHSWSTRYAYFILWAYTYGTNMTALCRSDADHSSTVICLFWFVSALKRDKMEEAQRAGDDATEGGREKLVDYQHRWTTLSLTRATLTASGLLGLGFGLGLEAKFSGLGLEAFGFGLGLVFLALALASFKAKAKVKVKNILPNTVYLTVTSWTTSKEDENINALWTLQNRFEHHTRPSRFSWAAAVQLPWCNQLANILWGH